MTLHWTQEHYEDFLRRRKAPREIRALPSVQAPVEKKNRMNKTETAYAEILEVRKREGEIKDYKFEEIILKLAPHTFYRPDFFVIFQDHFEVHEVKGAYIRDDAMAKFKIAADRYPFFRFKMIQRKKGSPFEVIRDL